MFALRRGTHILLLLEMLELALKAAEAREARRIEGAGLHRSAHRASRLDRVPAIAEAALRRELVDLRECAAKSVVGVPRLDPAQAWRVDDQAASGKTNQLAAHRGMAAHPIAARLTCRETLDAEQRVDECGLPHARRSEQRRGLARREIRLELVPALAGERAGHEDGDSALRQAERTLASGIAQNGLCLTGEGERRAFVRHRQEPFA